MHRCGILAAVMGAATIHPGAAQELPPASRELLAQRALLDNTVWAPEQVAQQYEEAITTLWDRLRDPDTPAAGHFTNIRCDRWVVPAMREARPVALNIEKRESSDQEQVILTQPEFTGLVDRLAAEGHRLVECEFHHTAFRPAADGRTAASEVGFLLHVEQRTETGGTRLAVTGNATVQWQETSKAGQLHAAEIRITRLRILSSPLQRGFVRAATFERRENEFQSAHPVLLGDLDKDGDAEIVIPRWNRRYDNQLATAKPQLVDGAFLEHWQPQEECGLLADLNADGNTDYVTVVKGSGLTVYDGATGGRFPHPGRVIFQGDQLLAPMALTAGDVDNDGDLDLFLTQYKPSYVGGQMPTPFYDANDGYPSFLLRNDDAGAAFTDITEAAGLAPKRLRRTYSASLVDLDADGDLDLGVVSDYAGLDVYRNDSTGTAVVFTDISASFDPNRLFGMAQAIADFDADGQLDILAIGMSSSTARRLDSLGLGREDREDYRAFRAAMGYGNRLFVRREDGFVQSPINDQIARTGWSWGVCALDFDNDGDRDIHVANGFRSGRSSKDYCSRYWCQDLYAGNSKENPALVPVFAQSMLELNKGLISWNGFEHNHLKMNLDGTGFENVAFLFGASFEYDARVAIAEDLDRDGREDLIVSEYTFMGRGFQSKVHLYLNRLPLPEKPNHWIAIALQPSPGQPVIGSTISVETSLGSQVHAIVAGDSFLSQDATTAHFGLGQETTVQKVTVRWPGGGSRVVSAPAIDRVHVLRGRQ